MLDRYFDRTGVVALVLGSTIFVDFTLRDFFSLVAFVNDLK